MPRVKIGSAIPDRKALDGEIARLRDLDVSALRARWHTVFRRQAPPHLPRHLVFRILAYRLQVDQLGDLDVESQRLLDRAVSPEKAGQHAMDLRRRTIDLKPGTVLGREWNGQMQRVAVLADGLRGMARPIRACRRWPSRLPVPGGMDRSSSACGTNGRKDPLDEDGVVRLRPSRRSGAQGRSAADTGIRPPQLAASLFLLRLDA
jgi:Protein of unknown function (DUF2924)